MSIEVYSFEDGEGNRFGSYSTQDIVEAKKYAARYRLRLIANTYEWIGDGLVFDYGVTPHEGPETEEE